MQAPRAHLHSWRLLAGRCSPSLAQMRRARQRTREQKTLCAGRAAAEGRRAPDLAQGAPSRSTTRRGWSSRAAPSRRTCRRTAGRSSCRTAGRRRSRTTPSPATARTRAAARSSRASARVRPPCFSGCRGVGFRVWVRRWSHLHAQPGRHERRHAVPEQVLGCAPGFICDPSPNPNQTLTPPESTLPRAGTLDTNYFKLKRALNGVGVWQNDCRRAVHVNSYPPEPTLPRAGTLDTNYFKLNRALNGAGVWQNDCRRAVHVNNRFDNNTAERGSAGVEANQVPPLLLFKEKHHAAVLGAAARHCGGGALCHGLLWCAWSPCLMLPGDAPTAPSTTTPPSAAARASRRTRSRRSPPAGHSRRRDGFIVTL